MSVPKRRTEDLGFMLGAVGAHPSVHPPRQPAWGLLLEEGYKWRSLLGAHRGGSWVPSPSGWLGGRDEEQFSDLVSGFFWGGGWNSPPEGECGPVSFHGGL